MNIQIVIAKSETVFSFGYYIKQTNNRKRAGQLQEWRVAYVLWDSLAFLRVTHICIF